MTRPSELALVGIAAAIAIPVGGSGAEFGFDHHQAVVLSDAVGARKRTGLDLAGVGRDRKVGDEGVGCLSRSMGDDGRVAMVAG